MKGNKKVPVWTFAMKMFIFTIFLFDIIWVTTVNDDNFFLPFYPKLPNVLHVLLAELSN